MNIDHIKDEFNTHYRPKIQSFFAPLQPLRKAILTFCYTTLWMVVLVVIIVMLLFKIIGWYYHHKYMSKYDERWYYGRDIWPRWWFDESRGDDDMRILDYHDDIFSRTEQYIDHQKRMMQDRINQIIDNTPTTLINLNTDNSTGTQQSISRISSINGNKQWYTLTVTNNTINWSIIGTISEKIIERLRDNNITLVNNNFSAPYTPELFQILTILLES